MDEEETKSCPNCKREIPAVNFTIHSVHCARNIRVCPVCKEPVPQAELEEHHEKLHKLLPCKQCGEMVCGSDLEDHLRDSCGHTVKSCRFCELELPRRKLPAHENYCGVRTEQCPDCLEWVMIKYRRLHLDSNHGFLRLDDDPIPQPKKETPKATIPKTNNVPKPTNIPLPSTSNGIVKNINQENQSRNYNATSNGGSDPRNYNSSIYNGGASFSSSRNEDGAMASVSRPQSVHNSIAKAPLKRTNDQPQINTDVAAVSKVNKDLPISRGAVKKRPAPKPPAREPPADPKRDLAFQSALQRHQREESARQEQSAYNLSVGLPPVLSAAAKLEKLRKMDALHNREAEDSDYKNKLQGRVWMPPDVPTGNVLGSSSDHNSNTNLEASRRRNQPSRSPQQDLRPPQDFAPPQQDLSEFRDLKPMSPQQFMERFNELRLRKGAGEGEGAGAGAGEREDRFSEIKSSLRELRRGLNEVTAPYNSNISNNSNFIYNQNDRPPRRKPTRSPPAEESEVELPCEFCGVPIPAHHLVLHQTGCRPDLAQYRPSSASRSPSPSRTPSPRTAAAPAPAPPRPRPRDEPVIPCEFCTESLPVYLISEHQERCGRDANLLYPD